MTTARARADAAHQDEISSAWRDWCRYLTSHIALIDLRVAQAGHTAFEREESGEEAEAELLATLQGLPPVRRVLFDALHEERRQKLQGDHEREARMQGGSHRMLDPDAIDRRALAGLLDEAEGHTTDDGWGLVPLGTPEQPEWYRVDVDALTDAPHAALYSLGQTSAADRQRRLRLFGVFAGGLLVLLAIWLMWPAGSPLRSPGQAAPALVNGSSLDRLWVPQTLVVASTETHATLPISATNTTAWPASAIAKDQHALWWSEQPLPLVICVPAALLQDAVEVRITSAGDTPERHYQLSAAPGRSDDLRLEACEQSTGSETARVRYGTLQATEATPDALPGEELRLTSDTHLTLHHVAVEGLGDDPTLPAGQSRVVAKVSVTGDTRLDWPALAPTLLMASGETYLPASSVPISDGMQFTYLIPAPLDLQEAVWSAIPPGQERPIRWRIQLAPPRSRDAMLQDSLRVRDIAAAVQNDMIQITAQVANQGTTPLQLVPADITLTQEHQAFPAPAIPELTAALAPGEQRSLSVAIPYQRGRRVLLTLGIGAAQYRLTAPAE